MGMDLYLFAKKGTKELDAVSGCWRNIAYEDALPEQLEEQGCTLFEFIEMDEEAGESYHDAAKVLAQVKKAVKVVGEMKEKDLNHGKKPLLEELAELQAELEKAAKHKAKVSLSVS